MKPKINLIKVEILYNDGSLCDSREIEAINDVNANEEIFTRWDGKVVQRFAAGQMYIPEMGMTIAASTNFPPPREVLDGTIVLNKEIK
jgi:hypothetical protein